MGHDNPDVQGIRIQKVHHLKGCHSRACDTRIGRKYARKLERRQRHQEALEMASGWAIPWYIVYCESKGINRPVIEGAPRGKGFYQIEPGTWDAYGGSPPNEAAAHPKAEQDRVARRIWNEAGASQWECS